ncbi:hypothetical protein QTQ03_08825 [Micromonospora sp. WMMA1363]|uniref:hypothetical protein n=1 Tax=Micromonospora sp. WMMA1363 TaxID=3053985 RepID=UPI00259CD9C2|nr:hypothetical protein [Micromonospora sp. WMMA1363]MDM4719676.1 hypothetical protein [Micromonospora sp. WMMA1363]
MTKLDRLARSVIDAHDIAKELTARRSSSTSAVPSTIRPMRWASCCSRLWR